MNRAGYPAAMRRLVNEFTKLPSIGERSATRLAYYLLTRDQKQSEDLAAAIAEARHSIRFCEVCFSLTDQTLCEICADPSRQHSVICVVEKPADVIAIERSGGYQGVYHVLHGSWSPVRGIGPEKTKLPELLHRLQPGHSRSSGTEIEEIVLATGTTVEGDATALYIANLVQDLGVRVSRIAQGLPKGGELEYADELTLTHAFEGRRRL